MPFDATDWTPETVAVWLQRFRDAMQAPAALGPTAVVVDDKYVLARLLVVFSDLLASKDASIGEMIASVLDENNAQGAALDVLGYRRGVPRLEAQRSRGLGLAKGTPGTKLGGVLVRDSAGATWQVEDGTIDAGGTVQLETVCTVDGPVPVLLEEMTLVSSVDGWESFVVTEELTQGRNAEAPEVHRARVIAARSVRGGVEFAWTKRLLEVSGVTDCTVTMNRSGVVVNGIDPHHGEAVVTGGSDRDVAMCLLMVAASASAGFSGNTLVTLPHPQNTTKQQVGTVDVRLSRSVDLRGWILLEVLCTGAPVAVNAPIFARQLRVIAAAWSQTLGAGDVPLSFDLEEYIAARVPTGTIVKATAQFSRESNLGPWSDLVAISKYERFRAAATPQPAQQVGTFVEPYVIGAGWNLDVSVQGGAPQSCVFLGTETTLNDLIETFNTAGLSGVVAKVSSLSTFMLETTATGLLVTLEILVTSNATLLTTLGLSVGVKTGTFFDVIVSIT